MSSALTHVLRRGRCLPAARQLISSLKPLSAHTAHGAAFRRSALQTTSFAPNKLAWRFFSDDPAANTLKPAGSASKSEDGFSENMKPTPKSSEAVSGNKAKHAFQAETRQILDIVAKSLYTDKEVFIRELISNASDALEKARYLSTTNQIQADADNLNIHISSDKDRNVIVFQDNGVGMTEEELISNLGTIANSGSKAFKQALEQGDSNIIGMFGVGFYSAFMVAHKVEVYTKSAKDGSQHYWVSDGSGEFEIAPAEGVEQGTKIIVHLNPEEKSYALTNTIEGVVRKYSNFVQFPIFLNARKLNTVKAIWSKSKNDVTAKEHEDFYRYIANAWDKPQYHLHFAADVPVDMKALFYVAQTHSEKHGMGTMEHSVSLYSRRVLIQAKCNLIVPDWLRFLKGVVDSEDIPLNISRENMQDSQLIARIKNILTKRIIKWLDAESKADPAKYQKFFTEFGQFIKEGCCADFYHKDDIARLLRFDSSNEPAGRLISLDEYISRLPPDQQDIIYLSAPNREMALNSPYYEQFKQQGTEVLLCFSPVDEFVMRNLQTYNKRKLVSAESAQATQNTKKSEKQTESKLSDAEKNSLVTLFRSTLAGKVSEVKTSSRLVSTPAIIVDHESATVRKMMQMVDQNKSHQLPQQKLEINPDHEIMQLLVDVHRTQPEQAKTVIEQIYDNALLAADLLDNPQSMLPRLNTILSSALKSSAPNPNAPLEGEYRDAE